MMKKYCVYLIERDDGLKYIGKTKQKTLKYRITDHKNSDKFKDHEIKQYYVLYETEDHDDVLEKETYYTYFYDTFRHGLNKTPDGKSRLGKSYKFTTFGLHLSEETKNKIRIKSKLNNNISNAHKWHNDPELRKKAIETMSMTRKGNCYRPLKFNVEDIEKLLILYKSKPEVQYINKKKHNPIDKDGNVISKNGKIITYDKTFCTEYAHLFNMTPEGCGNIISGKIASWKELYEKIINSKS